MNTGCRALRRRRNASLIEIALPSLFAATAHAATCHVNGAADDPGDASAKVATVDPAGWQGANASTITLRDCIVAANLMTGSTGAPTGSMTIDLSAIGGQTISLQNELPLIFNNASIDGGAGAPVTIDGGGAHRIFFVSGLPPIPASGTPDPDGSQPTNVQFSNLVLQNARATGGSGNSGGMGAGAALFVNKAATVTLADLSFQGNSAHGGNGLAFFPGGGGMGSGATSGGGGGLSGPSFVPSRYGAGIGTPGTSSNSGGFGGTGIGQISAAQNFNAADFNVDTGSGTSGALIGGGGWGTFGRFDGGFGGGGYGGAAGFSGNGGFGGGGGGEGAIGHNGGFGGGGGSGDTSTGGSGGFGGGGGGGSGNGGTGGGVAVGSYGGGGAGFGGSVFVRSGAALTVQSTTPHAMTGGSVAGGTGSGAAAGSGLCVMSGATVVFDVAGRYTIADSIDDDGPLSLPPGGGYTPGSGAAGFSKQGAGVLIIDGEVGCAGSIALTGGALGGTGVALGPVTLDSGAQIAPGDPAAHVGVGTLTTGPVTWNPGGAMTFQLGASAAASDLLVVAGALSKSGPGAYTIHFAAGNLPPAPGTTYTLIQAADLSAFDLNGVGFDIDATLQSMTGSFSIIGNDLQFMTGTVVANRIFADSFD